MTRPTTPPLEPGLVFVDGPDRGAMQRLVLGAETDGETLWVDAGGAANTYELLDGDSTRRELQGIHVARAFQVHQHHQLVRNLVAAAGGRTGLVVAPNVAALYEAADGVEAAVDRLFESSLTMLASLGDALSVPVLVSAPRASEQRRAAVRERAVDTVECRRTGLGYAFETDAFEPPGYWHRGWWQTTIPYWVDLCGAGAPGVEAAPTPAEAAVTE